MQDFTTPRKIFLLNGRIVGFSLKPTRFCRTFVKRCDHTPVLVGAEVYCAIVNINCVYISPFSRTIRRVSRHIARRNHLTARARALIVHGQHMARKVTSLLCISSPPLLLDKWPLVFNAANRAACVNEREYRASKNG